jgi:hypothetical protein
MLCRPRGSGSIISIRPNSCGPSARQHRDAPNPHGHPVHGIARRAEEIKLNRGRSRKNLVGGTEISNLSPFSEASHHEPEIRSAARAISSLIWLPCSGVRRGESDEPRTQRPGRPDPARDAVVTCGLRAAGARLRRERVRASLSPAGDVDSNFHVPVAKTDWLSRERNRFVAEPKVRIHLPPPASLLRTRVFGRASSRAGFDRIPAVQHQSLKRSFGTGRDC